MVLVISMRVVLPFGHPILLMSIRGQKLMLDAFFI
jgi:hypothetical protein